MIEAINLLGVNLQAAGTGCLAAWMKDAGFTRIQEKTIQIPLGTWPTNNVLREVGLCWREVLLDGLYAVAVGPLIRPWDGRVSGLSCSC